MRTVIFYSVLIIALFIFLLTVGLKILLNASVFIAQLTSKNIPSSINKSGNFIGTVDVTSIPTATNSSSIMVSGSLLNFDLLQFFINGEKVKEVNVSTKDTFTEKIGDLTIGNNEIYLAAIAKDGNKEKKSTTFQVFYKKDKPRLDIKSPQDGSKVSDSEINVIGSTDKETYVRVADSPVVVDAVGNFQTTVKLQAGDNKIRITAQDIAGNTEEKIITVTYQKD